MSSPSALFQFRQLHADFPFDRNYVVFKLQGEPAVLAIFSKFPAGYNINRACDAAWVIPLMNPQRVVEQLDSLISEIGFWGKVNGFDVPELVLCDGLAHESGFAIRWLVFTPESLLGYLAIKPHRNLLGMPSKPGFA
jgi:hypothetical protein